MKAVTGLSLMQQRDNKENISLMGMQTTFILISDTGLGKSLPAFLLFLPFQASLLSCLLSWLPCQRGGELEEKGQHGDLHWDERSQDAVKKRALFQVFEALGTSAEVISHFYRCNESILPLCEAFCASSHLLVLLNGPSLHSVHLSECKFIMHSP